MHILVATNNNFHEWRVLQRLTFEPRLPLPYMLGGAFLAAGHHLSAVDSSRATENSDINPFLAIYHWQNMAKALNSVDLAVLWGSDAVTALVRQAIRPGGKKNILIFSYVFAPCKAGCKQRLLDWSLRVLAGSARGLIFMTGEQARKAESVFQGRVPVIRLRCGIDTEFYRGEIGLSDVPEVYRRHLDALLSEPYAILAGDELRFNDDAVRFVEESGIRLVRISQYGHKSRTDKLKRDVAERRLGDKLMVFEKIDYKFLRFLLRHAGAYAGFVDSSWQPAGWTVACEALASGLPIVLYGGLVSQELAEAGGPKSCVHNVRMGDVRDFIEKIGALTMRTDARSQLSSEARDFAEQELDFGVTAPAFVAQVEKLVGR